MFTALTVPNKSTNIKYFWNRELQVNIIYNRGLQNFQPKKPRYTIKGNTKDTHIQKTHTQEEMNWKNAKLMELKGSLRSASVIQTTLMFMSPVGFVPTEDLRGIAWNPLIYQWNRDEANSEEAKGKLLYKQNIF